MIQLRHATFEHTDTGALTKFADGACYGALPHDEPHYHALAHRLGYAGDIMLYCREHELAHHLIAQEFGSHSPVIWALAHGETPPRMIAAAEEALVMVLQRYARANEVPLIEGVDWDGLKCRLLLTDKQHARDEGDFL
jgi:hypothetical protein